MKKSLSIISLVVVLVACNTQEPIPTHTENSLPPNTPPPNTTSYDGCAYQLQYPQELSIDGSGWYTFLGDDGQVFISAEKARGIDLENSLNALLDFRGIETSQATISSVTVVDINGQELPGLQADSEGKRKHTRIWVILRPETLLGDLAPADVVYQITVQTPIKTWIDWEPIADLIFQSFVPKDCGGV